MSGDEFARKHKRLMVALSVYRFISPETPDWRRLALWHPAWRAWLFIDCHEVTTYPRNQNFAIKENRRPMYFLKHESSVLAALARIHARQTSGG